MRLDTANINVVVTEIKLHQRSKILEIGFDDGNRFDLPYEYLRVFTPSAEALGHGSGQEILQTGKQDVTISSIKPVGNYGIAPQFSDGHDTGIYSWGLLYRLGKDYKELWQNYLDRLQSAGKSRHPTPQN